MSTTSRPMPPARRLLAAGGAALGAAPTAFAAPGDNGELGIRAMRRRPGHNAES